MMQLSKKIPISTVIFISWNLLDHDETIFYRTSCRTRRGFLADVYDPTIGETC